jgi:uncharacterized protein
MLADRIDPPGQDTAERGGTLPFFMLALGLTWALQLPAVLAMFGIIAGPIERFVPLAALGGFGPVIGAVFAARLESGGAGVRALFARLGRGPVGAPWHFIALGIFAAIYVAGTAVYRVFGGTDAGRWLYPPEHAQDVVAMILIPCVEEPGWRGFALPRLIHRYGALPASLLVGVGWACWHTMMFILQGATPVVFVVAFVNVLAGSVVFSWIYRHTRGSLWLAIVAHAGVHLNNPFHALPENLTPFVVYTVAIIVTACALVAFDRAAWQRSRLLPGD